jgi:hypothetical protein
MQRQCCIPERFRPAHPRLVEDVHAQSNRQTLPVCRLPHARAGLQPLRPRATLLHHRLLGFGPQGASASCRPALPTQPPRSIQARFTDPALASAPAPVHTHGPIGDASGFPTGTTRCCTANQSTAHAIRGISPAMRQPYRHPSPSFTRLLPLVRHALSRACAPGVLASHPAPQP